MKRYDFNSFEEFENSGISGEYEKIAVVHENGWVDADVFTECKTWKTAIRRFFKAIGNDGIYDGWQESMIEGCENGVFAMNNRQNGWVYGIEEIDDGLWYIFLNLDERLMN